VVNNFLTVVGNFSKENQNKNIKLFSHIQNKFSHSDAFYNFFFLFFNDFTSKQNCVNSKNISLNALNLKFQKMFLTSSMQQRIYNN
jgi:hypothetical protein